MLAAVCVLFLACSGDFRAGRPLQKENDRQKGLLQSRNQILLRKSWSRK